MSTDPNYALHDLIARLENHLQVVSFSRSDQDPAVDAAYRALADAFESYEDALYDRYNELLPFTIPEDDD
ncbi:hypothetical protein [Glutamicibacter endophyticus]|uniref:hypothetical protein n=1 Tax=Glutamicibacter endophyticus TaxID=1522174 RepID=UPI003AF11704